MAYRTKKQTAQICVWAGEVGGGKGTRTPDI